MSKLVPVLVPERLVGQVQAVVGVVERFAAAARARQEDFGAGERELADRVAELEAEAQALMLGELDETADRIVTTGPPPAAAAPPPGHAGGDGPRRRHPLHLGLATCGPAAP